MGFEPVTYRLEPADYLRIIRTVCTRRIGKALAIGVAILGGLAVLTSWLSGEYLDLIPTVAGAAAGGLYLLSYVYILLPRRVRTLFREQYSLSEEIALTLDDEGFQVRQASGDFRVKWAHLVKWLDCKDMIAVFPSRGMMIWFAERAVRIERLAYIKQHMIDSGLPAAGKLRKAEK